MMEDKKAKTSNMQNDKEILNGILTQINSFYSKAGILISVIGIVFGLSLTLLTNFKEYSACEQKLIAFAIIYILFVISSLITITFSVLVIFPRGSKEKKNNVNYYMDLCEMEYGDFKSNSTIFYTDESIFFNQIKTNAKICKKKHQFLRYSILSMIPCAIFVLVLIGMAIFL